MSEGKEKENRVLDLPVLILEELVLFPGMILSVELNDLESICAVNEAMNFDQKVLVISKKIGKQKIDGETSVGTIAHLKQVLKQEGEGVRILVKGKERGKIESLAVEGDLLRAKVFILKSKSDNFLKELAYLRAVKDIFKDYVGMMPQFSNDIIKLVSEEKELGKLVDFLAANLNFKYRDRQNLLNEPDILVRSELLMQIILNEIDILSIEKDLSVKLLNKVETGKREYFLREQKQLISKELGEDFQTENEELKDRVSKLRLPKEVKKHLLNECNKLINVQDTSQEGSVIRNYIELCIALPWNKKTYDKIDLDKAKKVLDKEHYGLEKVKERIIEILAVKKLTDKVSGQIICLLGPPGVGKTSIASSIAKAIGRKYARISLGGVHDEADIRGHRKTYVGAMPGRIITAIKESGSKNPLILLDEIDKLTKDQSGDPVSALLEVLDSEQNNTFYDHYIDMPFDLSNVFFIATANNYETIPQPLLDRMDIIDLVSYTSEEKFNIAKKHLIPKQLKKHGINPKRLRISDEAIYEIIYCYTRESGVRTLERTLASLMRKAAKTLVSDADKSIKIDKCDLEELLGPKKFMKDKISKKNQIGVSNGLAWTEVGGETISVEVATMPGKGKIKLTGCLGDVMKESAQTAISYIRSNAEKLNVDPDFYDKMDIHIHIPKGATPKDGPSAGVTLASAIISALTNKPVKQNVAMTGEITLRGRVLPVGGLREKTMAAYRAGMHSVIVPKENKSDLTEIDDVVKSNIKFIMADDMSTVLKNTLIL